VWGGTGARLYDHDDHHHALTTKGMAAPRRHALLRLQGRAARSMHMRR